MDKVSFHHGQLPTVTRLPPLGIIRYMSEDALKEGMLSVLGYPLFPVMLSPKDDYHSLNDALSCSAVIDTGKAIIQPYQC